MRTASGSVSISHSGSSGGASVQVMVRVRSWSSRKAHSSARAAGVAATSSRIAHLARGAVVVAVGAHRVERVAVGHDDGLQRLGAVALGLRVVEAHVPPRPRAVEHARALARGRARRPRACARRGRPAGPARSGSPAGGGAASRATGRRAVRRADARRDAVAEAPVDRALRRPQDRDRLAARADVLELAAHHRGEQAAPAVGGHDADRGHRGARHDGAGHRHAGGCRCRCRRRCARRRTTPASARARRCARSGGGPPRSARGGRPTCTARPKSSNSSRVAGRSSMRPVYQARAAQPSRT